MKSLKTLVIIFGALAAGALVLFGVHYLTDNYLNKQSADTAEVRCEGQHASRQVAIQNNIMNPENTQASLCDSLTIINKDNRVRLMAFGVHDKHQTYDGITEKALRQNESLTIDLNQTGTYIFHDHLQDEAQGTFTVTN